MSPLQPLSTPFVAPAKTQSAQLAEVSQQFEAIFVRQMLAEARKSHFGGSDLLGGQGMDTFRQMQDDRFADIAAERGSFGLAKMIETQIGAGLGLGASTGSARAGLEIGATSNQPGFGSNTNPAQPELVEGPPLRPVQKTEGK
jgi:peptidoglycan hydrolase FlgJ